MGYTFSVWGLCPLDPLLFCFHPFGTPQKFFLPTPQYITCNLDLCKVGQEFISARKARIRTFGNLVVQHFGIIMLAA